MESLEVIKVLQLLGTGLSVQSLVDKLGITYEHLCELAGEYPMLSNELYRWYPKWDFTVKQKEEPKAKDIEQAIKALNGGELDDVIISVDNLKKIAEDNSVKLDEEKIKEEAKPLEEILEVKPVKKKRKKKNV